TAFLFEKEKAAQQPWQAVAQRLSSICDSTGASTFLLLLQNIQQSNLFIFPFIGTLRFFCIFRNVPCLAGKKRTVHTPLGTVISNTAL
ncbi:hypothetical protein WMO41_13300, partial [Ventrimonas sp. CLA-AP-H27]